MGHKVHPTGFRLGFIRDWQSKWYAEKHYAEFVLEDAKLRKVIRSKYAEAAISQVEIDRQAKDVTLTLHTARPGIVIGRGGQRVDEMRLYLENLISKRVRLNIQEVRQPELDAYLVARSIAEQIERRVAYRRAMKQSIFRTIQAGAKGIKVSCAGRLGNAEIARRQTMLQGQVPLHTLRADIDYGFTEAHTTLGRIGVKVWIYKGEILPELKELETTEDVVEPAETPTEPAAEETPAVAPVVKLEAEPPEPVVEVSAEAVPATEPVEKPPEPVAEVATETTPATEAAEKPAKRRAAKKPKVATEEKAAEPAAEEKAAPKRKVKPAEKPAKPAARKRKKATDTAEPEKNAAEAAAEIKPEAEIPASTGEKEDKDGTTT